MNLKHLKKIRIAVSLIFFIAIGVLFVDILHILPSSYSDVVTYLQFLPSIIMGTGILGAIIIIILTSALGRVYCSSICPLGTLQDIIGFFHRKFKKKHKYKKTKPIYWLWFSLLGIGFALFLFNSSLIFNLLDPYSNFGRIISILVRPLFIFVNNWLSGTVAETFDLYIFYHQDYNFPGWGIIVFTLLVFITIIILVLKNGRLWCNNICPVGALLSLIARNSAIRINFDNEACQVCGNCQMSCKAGCIDIKKREIDFSRCVSCFNCMASCPENGIKFELRRSKNKSVMSKEKNESDVPNVNRRKFLTATAVTAIAAAGINEIRAEDGKATIKPDRPAPVSPPGSVSIDHFNSKCTSCNLCVTKCPTQVIEPTLLDYGFMGLLHPKMDFEKSFCNYDCTICGEVCPTGAIKQLSIEEKKKVQIGRVHFIKDNCVVYTDGTDCGSCAEHCPTKAVKMVPEGDIFVPKTNPDICVGCGACEHACPTTPYKAIYVKSNTRHKTASPPDWSKPKYEEETDEFPF